MQPDFLRQVVLYSSGLPADQPETGTPFGYTDIRRDAARLPQVGSRIRNIVFCYVRYASKLIESQ